MDPSSLETDIAALHRLDKGRYRYVTDLYCEKSRHDVRGYFPFAFSPGLRRALANTNFSLTARFRTAASLRFICLAIVTTLAPDNARVRRRSSSYGVQTGPADITSPSPSALGVPIASQCVQDLLSAREVSRFPEARYGGPVPVEACELSLVASPPFPPVLSVSPPSFLRLEPELDQAAEIRHRHPSATFGRSQ
jgi:hypothetical protein